MRQPGGHSHDVYAQPSNICLDSCRNLSGHMCACKLQSDEMTSDCDQHGNIFVKGPKRTVTGTSSTITLGAVSGRLTQTAWFL